MARPPRITPYPDLPLPLVYFVTLNVEGRYHVLNRENTYRAIRNCLEKVDGWHHPVGIVMPDHLHLLISPLDPTSSISDWSSAFKWNFYRWNRESWRWQDGCFDHLIRNAASGRDKLEYIRANPSRAGLVSHWLEWPYQWGTMEDPLFSKGQARRAEARPTSP